MFDRKHLALLLLLILCPIAAFGQTPPPSTLTINEAVRLALAQNPNIRAAMERSEAARARIRAARADIYPQVRAEAQYSHVATTSDIEVPSTDPNLPPTVVSIGIADQTAATISARQLIYTGGRVGASVSRAESLYDVALANQGVTEADIALQARQAYYNVLLNQSLVRSEEQNLAAAQAQLSVAQTRFEAGAAARFDVLRAQTQVSTAEQRLVEARNAVETAMISLNRIIGVAFETEYTLADPGQAPLPEVSVDTLVALAERQRGEVLAGRAEVAAQEANIRIARSARLPDVRASADYQIVGNETSGESTGWSFLATAGIEVFDGGRISAIVSETRSLRNEAVANLEETTRDVSEDVREQYLNLQTARQTIETARARLAQAQEAYDIAVVRYQAGVGTSTEISDALASLAVARTNLDTAIFSYNLAYVRLQRAVGRITY